MSSPAPHRLPKKRLRVALDIETSRNYGRRILAGISKYLVAHRRWSIYVEQHEIGSGVRQLLSRWKGEGIITRQATPDCVQLLRRRGLPAVDLSNFLPHLGIPRINSADREIGALAATHFLERGFVNFGCCGFVDQYWSQRRRAAYVEAVEAAGCACSVLERPFRTRAEGWDRDQSRLIAWLAGLPKPVAVFATNDLLGHHVLDACGDGALSVPEQVAVLGVDNDELLCGLCDPPLSSINPDPERIGFEAATWLDRMMQGEGAASDAFLEISPAGVVVRQSSDILAAPDEDFATALRFIREHACDGITVDDVAEEVAVSRSWLERHFRAHLGRSPQAEIRNVQIKRCMELLRDTEVPLRTISRLAGFKHIEYMSVVFKRHTGESPGRYRTLTRSRVRTGGRTK